jgi:hypothetical protein
MAAASVLAAALASLSGSDAAGAASGHAQERELARGAQVVTGDCPLGGDWTPPTDVRCEAYVVWWSQFASSATGRPDLDHARFLALVEHYVDVVHPDGNFDNLVAEHGGAATTGTFDARTLRSAHMDAVDVPMFLADPESGSTTDTPSGNTVHLGGFTWTAASRIYRWGNDGPVFGGLRHLRTPCGHLHLFAHQTLTVGDVTGTIEGRSIDELFQLVQIPGLTPSNGTGYIFDNAFRIQEVDRCAS